MDLFAAYTVAGLVTGSIYAVTASGLVVTYTTSGIFNFAHGAVGMLAAFAYWEFRVNQSWPAPIALIAVIFVIAPLLGALIERVLMRQMDRSQVVTSLVITIGLTVMLIGVSQGIWKPEARAMPEFFAGSGFDFLGTVVSWHQAITLVLAAFVAVLLWYLLTRTRLGVAMRAVVDDRNLASLTGAQPSRISMLSWAIGSSLAALGGVLIAPVLQLDTIVLTFLVINAYAAAMVGRLRSLPLTFAGAFGLGLAEEYFKGYVDLGGLWQGLRPSLPALLLFAVLLLMPEERLRANLGRSAGAKAPRVPSLRESFVGAGALVGAVGIASLFLDPGDVQRVSVGLATGVIMLSLVLLTGYGGQVSLAQLTFAGFGAFAMAEWGGDGSIVGLVLAAAIAAPIGALVALPALRLQGLYLALATMAFAVMAVEMIFVDKRFFGFNTSLRVGRLDLGPISFDGEVAYMMLVAAIFGLVGVFVLWIRRGPFGRVLSAMGDSPAACATLGLDLTRTKLAVFAISAAMAGLGGALLGGARSVAGPVDFVVLQNLPVLLLAVVGGITTVSGALIGGLALALLPLLQERIPDLAGIVFLLTGAAAVSLGRNPNGIAFFLSETFGRFLPWRHDAPEGGDRGTGDAEATEEVHAVAVA
ncbi:MAG TPA: ABC transporter permease [Acidimicrobiia bacterium]|nr:ABC transporter permease [Acidimicrobiia bacterium]